MNLKQAKTLLKSLYHTQVKTGERISIEMQSGPGVGKSESVAQVARELQKALGLETFGFRPFFLSTLEAPDVRGFALPSKDKEGRAVMTFTEAPWMPRVGDPEHGILFLDEFRQAGHDVQKPAAELLLNGAVGDSKLPITWMVVAASNRERDRSGVQRELAFISNRRMLIEIHPELDAWVDWAERRDIHWCAIAFAKAHPGLVFGDALPEKGGPFCSPRTLVKVSHLIEPLQSNMALFNEAAAGLLGEGTAAQFVAFLRVAQEIPSFEDIVKNPTKCRLPDVDRPDAQYATMQMIAHRCSKDTAKPAFEYLQRMPKEFQVSGLKAALTRCADLVHSKGFASWLRENRDLVMNANLLDRT